MSRVQDDAARHLPLVTHPDEMTPDWLNAILARNGIHASVASLSASAVGTGQMADNYRLTLQYAEKPPGAPETLVAKVSSADPTSRASGARGGYATEVRFYLELADQLAVRTPRCYHGDISQDHEQFVLLFEDLAPAEQGDQVRGCTTEDAELALRNLAGLHGSRWCDASLDRHTWLSRVTPDVARLFGSIMAPATEAFIDRYQTRLSPEDAEILRSFASQAEGWLSGRPQLFAPLHGDYRLDNLMFGTAAGGAPVAAVDWQTLSIGHPGRDVAYFLGNSLVPEVRREQEESLVRVYHEALVSHGVRDYSFDDCFDDYRFGHFQGPLVTVLGAMAVIQTERGDEMFMAMCSRGCQAIRDLDSASLI